MPSCVTMERQQRQQYGLDCLGSEYRRGKRCYPSPKRPHQLQRPASCLFNVHRGYFPGVKMLKREVNHSPPPLPGLRKSGTVSLHPLCASIAWTEKKTLPFTNVTNTQCARLRQHGTNIRHESNRAAN
jgi:hypothetical protein